MFNSVSIGAFLLTYFIHSSLLMGGVWLVTRVWRAATPEHRELLWKLAMVGGILTSVAQCYLPVPHWGTVVALLEEAVEDTVTSSEFALAEPAQTEVLSASVGELVASNIESPRTPENPTAAIPAVSALRRSQLWAVLACLWLAGCVLGLARLVQQWGRLQKLHVHTKRVTDGPLVELVAGIARRMGLRQNVEIYMTPRVEGPMVAGLIRWRLYLPVSFVRRLDRRQLEALVAHELAHVARRDTRWNLIGELICGAFFFQPLNFYARRQMRIQAEYLADLHTADVLADGLGLARCLTTLAEWTLSGTRRRAATYSVAVGMGAYRSILGQRVQRLLQSPSSGRRSAKYIHRICALAMLLVLTVILVTGPRALAKPSPARVPAKGEESMSRVESLASRVAPLAVALSMFAPAVAEEQPLPETTLVAFAGDDVAKSQEIAKVPQGMYGFSGQIIGQVVEKDAEQGLLVLKILKINRLWKGNKAENASSGVGKVLRIEGIAGKWIDSLLLLKNGDTIEIEANHVRGDSLSFIPEGFRKVEFVAPPQEREREGSREQAEEQDSAAFPAGIRGFSGMLVGKVVSKDAEKGEIVVKVTDVPRVWKNNKAEAPKSAVGKTLTVDGVFGKFLDVLVIVKPGDTVELEAKHISGERMSFPGEWLRKVE